MVVLCPGFLTSVHQTLTLLQPLASGTSRAGPSMAQQSEPETLTHKVGTARSGRGSLLAPMLKPLKVDLG